MKQRYQQIITAALPHGTVESGIRLTRDYRALVTAMRRAEHDSLDMRTALRAIDAGCPIAGGTSETRTRAAQELQ